MNHNKNNLVNNIIENEFSHIQEYKEMEFIGADKEQRELAKISESLLKKIKKDISQEHTELLNDFCIAIAGEWINICRFYFKQGIVCGTTNLSFLKDDETIQYIRQKSNME